jgi:hypothetical protein
MKPKFPTGKVVFLFIFFGIGFGFLATSSWMMHADISQARQSLNFVPVEAVIQNNTLQPRPDGERLVLAYTYTIDGKTYTGSRYNFGIEERDFGEFSKHPMAQEMRRFHQNNPVGTQITVFVDPRNPAEATIIRGHVYQWYEVLFLTIITAAFGVGLFTSILAPRFAAKHFESSDPS